MPLTTFGVATAVTPSVIETYFSHYLNRKPLKSKPTAHISYHEGLRLIRQFLDYSAKHSVEDLQTFTAQWVPVPTWVRTQEVEVPPQFLTRSANIVRKQLGSNGIKRVGGEKWWQWRRPEVPLHAEWIEMKKDHNERKRTGEKCERVILYVHGGAYYFGSVDEHRYQMQRHARKLRARVLAPRYRLAPQFPFPCGLYDCIATYFYLLEHFQPNQILFAGDSAGGGLVLSMLVTLRDQGCPLPAGTMLLSPWVDLTHSFPSVAGEGVGDYIPPYGFHHKPSMAWPPPPTTEEDEAPPREQKKYTAPVEQPFDVVELPATMESSAMSKQPSRDNLRAQANSVRGKKSSSNIGAEAAAMREGKKQTISNNQIPGMGPRLELQIDDKLVIIREQFQMYAKNELLSHPLVSPVQQPSLGGLPPMLIQVGGAELLRDEQIYLAHKAANPKAYPPSDVVLDEYDPGRTILNLYPPTNVQLQVWEDLCHVPHTLSFTRPAKYMYRSVAQFGAWALAQAQQKTIEILDDDAISVISEGEDPEESKYNGSHQEFFGSIGPDGVTSTQFKLTAVGAVGKAGDELPPFKDHMIRQRVNRHGTIFPLPRIADIASLHLDPNTIGAIKTGPVKKWLTRRAEYDQKFASEYKKLNKKKLKEAKDYDKPDQGERPPATALVNRRRAGTAPEIKKKGKSWGLAMWSGWGSSHDESTIEREQRINEEKVKTDERPVSAATTTRTNGAAYADTPRSGSNATGANTLLVPGHGHEMDAQEKGRRRTSSSSILAPPWSLRKRTDSRPRSPYKHIKDEGQASTNRDDGAVSPVLPDTPAASSSKGFWDLSRHSSTASGRATSSARPTSTATMLSSNLNPRSRNDVVATDDSVEAGPSSPARSTHAPTSVAAPTAPTMSDTSADKAAIRVPGSENTFLNAESSRPHDNVSAFPFKLKDKRRNVRDASPNPSTMTLDSNDPSDHEPGSARNGINAAAVELPTGALHAPAPPVEMAGSTPKSETETVPVLQTTLDETDSSRRVSMLPDDTRLSNILPPDQDPVSPLEEPNTASTQSSFSAAPAYRSRDSRLGTLGADGMPTSAWPESNVASDSASRAAPFKIRNPVYDARAASPPAVAPVSQGSQPAQLGDASKAAPFRMRHTVYDSKVAPPGTKPPPQSENSPGVHELSTSGTSDGTNEKQVVSQHYGPPSPPPTGALPAIPILPTSSQSSLLSYEPGNSITHIESPQASINTSTIPLSAPVHIPKAIPAPNAAIVPPAATTPTRPVITRRGSSDLPPTPPPKDSPKLAQTPTPATPLSQGSTPIGILERSSSRQKQQVVPPTSKFFTENSRTPPKSVPAGAAAALNEATGSRSSDYTSTWQRPEKVLPPGAAAALSAVSGQPVATPSTTRAGSAPAAALSAPSGHLVATLSTPRAGPSPSSTKIPTTSNILTTTSSNSHTIPPTIGDLSFEHSPISPFLNQEENVLAREEQTRPPLETFTTANDGLGLRSLSTGKSRGI